MDFVNDDQAPIEEFLYIAYFHFFVFTRADDGVDDIRKLDVPHKLVILLNEGQNVRHQFFSRQIADTVGIDFLEKGVPDTRFYIPCVFIRVG